MKTNFKRMADIFYKKITVNDVIKEAVMNSIQANATSIVLDFQFIYEKDLYGKTQKLENLKKIIIEDNGDGLTQENIDAFLEIATDHKKNIGCKGIGRISFLKIASDVKVESFSNEKTKIDFNFTYEINETDIKKSVCENIDNSYTKIHLETFKLPKSDLKEGVDSCINFVEETFNLMLFLKQKETNKIISIKFLIDGKDYYEVKSNDINCLKTFVHKDNNCDFKIYSFKNAEKKGIKIYYCANSIQVKKNTISKDFDTEYMFAITSSFFDNASNPERTRINTSIEDNSGQQDIFQSIPNHDYETKLKEICLKIIHENEPDIQDKNKAKLEELKKYYGYFDFSSIDIKNLVFDEKSTINDYRKNINKKEDKLVSILKQENLTADKLVSIVKEQNKHELAKYIFHRDLIAKKGLSLTNSKENEKTLHELFFPQKISVDINNKKQNKSDSLYQNNIWLLDDKFMTYTYIASDVIINKIRDDINIVDDNTNTGNDLKRPDLFILYNMPEDSESPKDVVLVEFKKGDINFKDKTKAIDQVDEYKSSLEKLLKNINNFYSYIICDFEENDEGIERSMTNRHFTKVFSNYGCMYYGYLNASNMHVTFMSTKSVFSDAIARNKTFLNVLTNSASDKDKSN